MQKRLMAFVVATTLMLGLVLTTLTGCGNDVKVNGIYGEDITVGEWLGLVNQKFGFTECFTDEPFFAHIRSDHPYFSTVQVAVNAGVLPTDYKDLDLEQHLTREFTALTLAGAIYFQNTDNVYIEDIDHCTYPDQIKTIINNEIMFLNDENAFCPEQKVLYVEAAEYLQAAHNCWANYTFNETVYECELQEDVIDLYGFSTVTETADDSYEMDEAKLAEIETMLEEIHLQFDNATGTITLDDISKLGVTEGSVLVLPEGYGNDTTAVVRVTDIAEQEDGTYKLETEVGTLLDVFEDFVVQETIEKPDFTKCEILDMEGNPIEFQVDSASDIVNPAPVVQSGYQKQSPVPMMLSHNGQGGIVQTESKVKEFFEGMSISKEFDFGDNINLKVTIQGNSIYLSAKTKTDLVEGVENDNSKLSGLELSGTLTAGMEDVMLTTAVEIKKEKVLWAEVPTGINYAKIALDYDRSTSFGVGLGFSYEEELFQIPYEVIPGVVTAKLVIGFKLSVNGELMLTYKVENCEHGMEYRNGNLSWISTKGDEDFDAKVSLTVEATCPINIELEILYGLAKIYAGVEFGVGATGSVEENTIDYPDQEPYDILCAEVKSYLILKINAGAKITCWGATNYGPSKSWEILNADNATILKLHFENWKLVSECSVKDLEKAKEAAELGVGVGNGIELDKTQIEMQVGESAEINIVSIPQGYSLTEDITTSLSDRKAFVLNNGSYHSLEMWSPIPVVFVKFELGDPTSMKFTAEEAGTYTATYKTKDSMHAATCEIIVTEKEEEVEEEQKPAEQQPGNSSGLRLSQNYISVSPGNTKKLEVTSVPGTFTEADLVWESEDPSVASVDASGNVTGVKNGVTTIIVKTKDGAYSYRCTVTVFEGIDAADVKQERDIFHILMQKV